MKDSALSRLEPMGEYKASYAEATRRMEIWGLVVRERMVTGDPTAIPVSDETYGSKGSGLPSDPNGSLLIFCEADLWVRRRRSTHQRLLEFAFVDSWVEESRVRWVFKDGSTSEELYHSDVEPSAQVVRVETVEAVRRRSFDLANFHAEELAIVERLWGMKRVMLLEKMLLSLMLRFARDHGL